MFLLQSSSWCGLSGFFFSNYPFGQTKFDGHGLSSFWDLAPFCLPLEMAKFSLQTMVVHGSQKIKLAQKIHASRSWPKMHASQFWWAWCLQFWRNFLPSEQPNFPLGPWTIVHGGQKMKLAQKIYVSRSWPKMYANQIWWACPLPFWRYCYFQNRPNFPFGPWGSKNKIGLRKFMQVEVNPKRMQTNFSGHGFSGFWDLAPFEKWPKFPFRSWTIVHGL